MVIYILKIKVDRHVLEGWIKWMQDIYIQKAMSCGHFSNCKVYQMHRDERGGRTYALHLSAKSLDDLETFLDNIEPDLLRIQKEQFRGRVFTDKEFMNLLEDINER